MLQFSRWKIIVIVLICLLNAYSAFPNLFDKATVESWPNWITQKQISLGLDLRGGAHLLYEMDINELRTDWLANIRSDVRQRLRRAKIGYTGLGARNGKVRVTIRKPEEVDRALTELRGMIQQVGGLVFTGTSDPDMTVNRLGSDGIEIELTQPALVERVSTAIGAAMETVRRRVDPGGNKEVTIQRQGNDRILIQVPGVKEDEIKQLKDRIGTTAKLTFQLVHPSMTVEEARATRVPTGYKIYPPYVAPDQPETQRSLDLPELLQTRIIVSGEDLVDAQQSFDQRDNQPVVTFRFNTRGAKRFGRATQRNVRRRFAIVLDNKVISAPVIQEPILGGSGQISGNFSVKTAGDLAILLRSGALPAKLTIKEERTVGPSLGADSIAAGKTAFIIGGVAVVVFMIFAYGLFGVFAVSAVGLNIVIILGLMTFLQSTLTLPGIAGIVLTVGMAVDANVLIFERIREELRSGKSTISAIESGFARAQTTILDSNLTTLIAGIVMFWLGSGPIRGFAITLSLGIMTTVFTAFTVTRMLVWLWVNSQKTRRIPAPL